MDHLEQPSNINGKGMDIPTHTHRQTHNKPSSGTPCNKINPNFVTIIFLPYHNWYHDPNPHEGPFPNSHTITHFKANTVTYEEPTILLERRIEPRTKSHAIQILCIHYKNAIIGSDGHTQLLLTPYKSP